VPGEMHTLLTSTAFVQQGTYQCHKRRGSHRSPSASPWVCAVPTGQTHPWPLDTFRGTCNAPKGSSAL